MFHENKTCYIFSSHECFRTAQFNQLRESDSKTIFSLSTFPALVFLPLVVSYSRVMVNSKNVLPVTKTKIFHNAHGFPIFQDKLLYYIQVTINLCQYYSYNVEEF